jgi:class 3 adenylate cyclase/tetratricopeptide (TPR) repeat protein
MPKGLGASDVESPADSDEVRPVTSLFADVVGSTGLGERLSAAEVKALIGECVTRMCESIEAFGGCVRSYMGDGVAGFFGIDAAREDDCERAARAALEILRGVSEYSREVEAAWGVSDFNVRIGINAGRVAVGRIGAADPQRLALGDSINVAARLQAAAPPGAIYVGTPVADAICDRFILQAIGAIKIRGRASEVQAFELEAEGEGQSRSSVERVFVGRTFELDILTSSLDELLDGRGQVAVITGEAGLGKSRLMREARKRASSDVLWLDGYCDAMDERLPYQPFVEALCAWLGVSRQASSIEMRVRLNALGKELFEERFDDRMPFLARLLGVSLSKKLDRRMDGLPGDEREAGLVRALADWLTSLASVGPVVLAIDNFCSAAEPTVRATEAVLAQVETAPILLMLAARTEADGPWRRLRSRAIADMSTRTLDIRLNPLSVDESQELAQALRAEEPLVASLSELVVQRAEGNPLYVEELLAAISEKSDEQSDWHAHLPSALEGVLLARIDGLPEGARRVLQAAAVLGRTFTHDVLLGVTDGAGGAEIARLVRADVIRERGRTPRMYAFRHGLIREAALSTLTPEQLQTLNSRAAMALQDWHLFDADRDACALVGYYTAAGRGDEAADCLERLATQLARVYRWGEAAALLERCLAELKDREGSSAFVNVSAKLATMLEELGRSDDALRSLDAAIAREDVSERRWELRIAKARSLTELGRVDEADELLQTCIASSTDQIAVSEAHIQRGVLALNREDINTAARCIEILGEYRGVLPTEVAFHVASLTAGVKAVEGSLNDAESWSLRAQEIAEQLGQVNLQLNARHNTALVCMLKGLFREASGLMQSAYDHSVRLGILAGRPQTAASLMHLHYSCGDLEAGARIGEEAMALASGTSWESLIAANLAAIRSEQGHYVIAKDLATMALRQQPGLAGWVRVGAMLVRATAAFKADDLIGEERELRGALECAMADGGGRATLHVCLALSDRCMRLGEVSQASSWLDHGSAQAIGADVAAELALGIAKASLAVGTDVENAIEMLRRARLDANRMGLRLHEGRALLALANVDASNRDLHLADAEILFAECGSRFGLEDVARIRAETLARSSV